MDKNKKAVKRYGFQRFDFLTEANDACNEHQEWNVVNIQYIEEARKVFVFFYIIEYED